MIRFTLTSDSTSRSLFIDDVVVDGPSRCPGAGVVSAAAPADLGTGGYSMDVASETGGAMTVWLECSWDSPAVPVEGSDSFAFVAP